MEALARSPETTLVACGDDPLSQGVALRAAARGTRTLAFGIGEDLGLAPERVTEARFCQVCGAPLSYDYRTYAQLGAFRCPNGDFSRPELDYVATGVSVSRKGVSFVAGDVRADTSAEVHASFGGTYMVYNLLAAFAVASLAGVGPAAFQRVLDGYHPENGRMQRFRARGREVILNLAKNPTGFNQNIGVCLRDPRKKAVVFIVNSQVNDGHDISWLWDVDYERLAAAGTSLWYAGGERRNDLQVRLKYAGIPAKLSEDTAASVKDAIARGAEAVYVLPNYSALVPARDAVAAIAQESEMSAR